MKHLLTPILFFCCACSTTQAPSDPASGGRGAANAECCSPDCCGGDPDCCTPGCCAETLAPKTASATEACCSIPNCCVAAPARASR